MTEQINPPPQPDGTGGNPLPAILWLFVAFIPSLVSIHFLGARNPPQWLATALLILSATCCLCSGFGVLAGVKDVSLRIVLGLVVAIAFFVLNVIVVIFVGCSGMGRIAP